MTYRSVTVHSEVAAARHWCARARPWRDTKCSCSCGLGTAKSPRLGTPRGQQDQLTAREVLRPHCSVRRWRDSCLTHRQHKSPAGMLWEKTALRIETLLVSTMVAPRAHPKSPMMLHKPPQSLAVSEPGGATVAPRQWQDPLNTPPRCAEPP